MPRIDPLQLLTCLKVLLAANGGIRSAHEVKRLAGLMTKYSKKLVSKCIYVQILKCTKTELLGQFMGSGGWSLTHIWLSDGIRAMNWPLVQEILELLLLCPVDVQRLRSNTAPKLVKSLCKDGGNEGVRILACKLVEQWLKIVKGETLAASADLNRAVRAMSTEKKDETNSGSVSAASDGASQENRKTNIGQGKLNNASGSMPGNDTTATNNTPQTSISDTNTIEEDPLAIPASTNCGEADKNVVGSSALDDIKNSESALVYKIMVKDGKQILAKVENSTPPSSSSGTMEEKAVSSEEPEKSTAVEEKSSEKAVIVQNEKDIKESSNKENKDSKENEKDKYKSNKDKDKDKSKDRKSSSSHHRSSSSSSTKSTSKTSSSSSSSKKTSHRTSDSSKSRDKEDSRREKDRDSEKEKHKSSKSSSSSSSSSNNNNNNSSSSNRDKEKNREREKDRSSSSRDKKDKDKERDKEKEKEREKEKEKEREKEKEKEREREKEKDKEREKITQAEKDKDTLSKVMPPTIDKIGKIPKKPKEDCESEGKSSTTSITIPSKKASISIEIRKDTENRPKTVKTYNSQFRSHGLAEEAPPPPSRKGLKKPPSQLLPGTAIPPVIPYKRASPPRTSSPVLSNDNKDQAPPEKKVKIDLTTTTTASEKPGAIKLIAPKPKPQTLVESDMFMDALFASAHPKKDTKKRKRRTSSSKDASKDGSPPSSPTSSSSTKVAPLKFYQDTLEDRNEEKSDCVEIKDDDDDKNEDEDDIPLKRVKEEIERQEREDEDKNQENSEDSMNQEEEEEEEVVKKPPGPGCGPDGPPGVLMLHRRKGPKKKLKWRPQEELEEVRFFELDENERVNVTKTFTDMKQMERYNEREGFLMARKLSCEDIMTEQTPWNRLVLVEDVPPHPEGNQSKEKKIQSEREQTTLKALYFNRQMIPDTASEPDMEQYQITEPAVIPLEDVTGNPDAVNDFTSMPWPDPKGSPPHNMPDDFMGGPDGAFPGGQFNPFMPYGPGGWQMGPGGVPPPNGIIQPSMVPPPMAGFNNMNMGPANMMLSPDELNCNMNMMQQSFGPPGSNFNDFNGPPGPNFNGPPSNNQMGFNNFVPPIINPNINQNLSPNMNQSLSPNMNMAPNPNMNNMARGGGNVNDNGGARGNWRSGGPLNMGNSSGGGRGGGWRPQGPSNSRNWNQGNGRICKQFQRGFCRNGNKCIYVHTNAKGPF